VGVSCPSVSMCAAVGQYATSVGIDLTFAEQWNGARWLLGPSVDPSGASGSDLAGVSCTSASRCTAVGGYSTGSGSRLGLPLAEGFNGTKWTVEKTPHPSNATKDSTLSGVACASASNCTAVGSYTDGGDHTLTLVESWDGATWVIQPSPNPAGTSNDRLSAVSCTSVDSCLAVGSYPSPSGSPLTLAEKWDGRTWSISPSPDPSAAESASFSAVSCSSASSCVAVGSYQKTAGAASAFSEEWNGETWAIAPMAEPAGALGTSVSGVSCPIFSACTAVGDFVDPGGMNETLTEAWNGSRWTVEKALTVSSDSSFAAVSCTTASACAAVGGQLTSAGGVAPLAGAWNGKTWASEPTPGPVGVLASRLSAVSCPSSTDCVAVGSYRNVSGVLLTLSEAWNGRSWVIEPTPNPGGGAYNAVLSAVSCTSASECTAVGDYRQSSGAEATLAEAWNGTEWAIEATPNPTTTSSLSAVSCEAASDCVAVGQRTQDRTLAERWNGDIWVILPTPSPPGSALFLDGISCSSASRCVAVGTSHEVGTASTFAEAWNGTTWTIEPTPNPAGAKFAGLEGVSCLSASFCIATGDYTDSQSVRLTLAETWNGSKWVIRQTPDPTGARVSSLPAVSCTSRSFCTAVGLTVAGSTGRPLAESWNGSVWTIDTMSPPGWNRTLSGVSCTAAPACAAVGDVVDSTGTDLTLAERYA
jgi:hypothetical protein